MDCNQWKGIFNELFSQGHKYKRRSKPVKMEFHTLDIPPTNPSFSFQESTSVDIKNILNKNTETIKKIDSALNNKSATVDRAQKSINRISTLSLCTQSDGSFIRNNFGKEINSDCSSSNEVYDATKHKHPIMGKKALLKRSSSESSDSAIIQSIILNKYENVLNYYVNRMYTRMISRVSNSGEDTNDNRSTNNESVDHIISNEATKDTSNNSICSDIDIMSTYSGFNQRQFLVEALGETTSNYCNSNSSKEACEESVGTSGISSLLSNTSIGSSLKRILKRNKSKWTSRTDIVRNEDMDFNKNNKCSTFFNPNSVLDQYKMELSKQNSIIFQTSKALNYCKSSKNFIVGRERIEAERILLIATLTKEALIKEINSMEFDSYAPEFDSRCTGEVTISKITFNQESIPKRSQDCKEYFIVIVNNGKTVFDSGLIDGTYKSINIHKHFKFSDLQQEFEINIAVYSLLILNEGYIAQDGKSPSPKSLIKCNKHSSKSNIRNSFIPTEIPAFNLIGKCHIKYSELARMKKNENLRLKWHYFSSHTSLYPFVEIDVQYTFKLTNKLSGFLTLGFENGVITWNRRWCVLDGFMLQFWNYPSDESSIPIDTINLKYCAEDKIHLADRSACARPKTLYLPLRDSQHVIKYFLSADNQSDLKVWEKELNFVVQSLIVWKGLENDFYK